MMQYDAASICLYMLGILAHTSCSKKRKQRRRDGRRRRGRRKEKEVGGGEYFQRLNIIRCIRPLLFE